MWQAIAPQFEADLHPDERLLWVGQPQQGFVLRLRDTRVIFFLLVWGLLVGYLVRDVAFGRPLPTLDTTGVIVLLAGLYLAVDYCFVDSWRRARTYYSFTNERVLIVSGLTKRRVRTVDHHTLVDMTLDEALDGSGTITFAPDTRVPEWQRVMMQVAWYYQEDAAQFEGIPNVRDVYRKIQRVQQGMRSNTRRHASSQAPHRPHSR